MDSVRIPERSVLGHAKAKAAEVLHHRHHDKDETTSPTDSAIGSTEQQAAEAAALAHAQVNELKRQSMALESCVDGQDDYKIESLRQQILANAKVVYARYDLEVVTSSLHSLPQTMAADATTTVPATSGSNDSASTTSAYGTSAPTASASTTSTSAPTVSASTASAPTASASTTSDSTGSVVAMLVAEEAVEPAKDHVVTIKLKSPPSVTRQAALTQLLAQLELATEKLFGSMKVGESQRIAYNPAT